MTKDFTPDFLITPYVLYEDKSLNPLDMSVYSVIYWFENMKDGICKASNTRIAKIVKSSPATVANSLGRLERGGYVERGFDSDGNRTFIKCLVKMSIKGVNPQIKGGSSVDEGGVNPQINRESKSRESKRDKYNSRELLDTYSRLYYRAIGQPYVPSYAKDISTLNKLSSSYGPVRAMALIFTHFEWRGIDGTDNSRYNNLKNNGFPISWISSQANAYVAYTAKEMSDVWEDDTKLAERIDEFIKQLRIMR